MALQAPEVAKAEEPKAEGGSALAARDLSGLWAMTDPGRGTLYYEWYHEPGSSTFTGRQQAQGPVEDGVLGADGTIDWTVDGVLCRGHLADGCDSIQGGLYWQKETGELVGTFTGLRKKAYGAKADPGDTVFQDWADGLFFSLDRNGEEQLLDADGIQVMMQWERPWMERCVERLAITRDCDVLEVGFGCGYSAMRIQADRPRSHTIIECSDSVLERLRPWAAARPGVRVVEGTWQRCLPELGVFDRIFFDDYGEPGRSDDEMHHCPNASYREMYNNAPSHFHAFLHIVLQWHAREGTLMSGYVVSPIEVERDDVEVDFERMGVAVPVHCDYYHADCAIVPLFVKVAADDAMIRAEPNRGRTSRSTSLSSTRSSSGAHRRRPRHVKRHCARHGRGRSRSRSPSPCRAGPSRRLAGAWPSI